MIHYGDFDVVSILHEKCFACQVAKLMLSDALALSTTGHLRLLRDWWYGVFIVNNHFEQCNIKLPKNWGHGWCFIVICCVFMMTSSNGTISVLLVLCAGYSPVIGYRWIPLTKTSDDSSDVLFDLRLNKRLSKQSWGWWLETPSCRLWRHSNARDQFYQYLFVLRH